MDKLYIDCNIILDWLTNREPFCLFAEKLIARIEKKQVEGYISPLTLANTYYLFQKNTDKNTANAFLDDCRKIFIIIDITREITYSAINNKFRDFEDDLHYFTAVENKLDFIITRNEDDFIKNKIEILNAEEYLRNNP